MDSFPLLKKGWCVVICVLYIIIFSLICDEVNAVEKKVEFNIDGNSPIAETDENFICATLDFWPSDNCDNRSCSWVNASLFNLDLSNVILFNAIKAFSPLKMRLGGTLQDKTIYQTHTGTLCVPFVQNSSQIFNYTEGCFTLARWDELNSFMNQTGAEFVFGINALYGKTIDKEKGTATGPWNSSNAASFFDYTRKKGHKVLGWELGNELGGVPMGISVAPDPYANDTITLARLIRKVNKNKPLVLSPGGLFNSSWFDEYLNKTPGGDVNVITLHIYNVGSGFDEDLVNKILNTTVLDSSISTFKNMTDMLKNFRTSTVAWVSEGGGVYSSGRDGVTNAFVFSFWYLDILGLASTYHIKTFCRQTLIGGNYGLLDTATFVPNPDYYSALLWNRLMGRYVLSIKFTTKTKNIRAYAHCAKKLPGITILLINLDRNITFKARPNLLGYRATTEEYHLTPKDGNLTSRTVLLNGVPLTLESGGVIPPMEPVVRVNSSDPITVDPLSIVFVHMPQFDVPACKLIGN